MSPGGQLCIWDGRIFFAGAGIVNDLHKHYTASILIAVDGECQVRLAEGDWQSGRGFAVAPNAEQQLDSRGITMLVLQVDPDLDDFQGLAPLFADGSSLVALPEKVIQAAVDVFAAANGKAGFEVAEQIWDVVFENISGFHPVHHSRDQRIERVVTHLRDNLADVPGAADLAAVVGLSEGRLTHLFKEQMGLAIRPYIKWLRVREVVRALAEGKSLTDAAYLAGFSDAAHMSRTFKSMFGMQPSFLVKNSRFVQVDFGKE